MKRRQLLGICALAGLSSACSTPIRRPGADSDGPWVQGRLLVRVAATAERGSVNESLVFELRGSGNQGELHLSSPLGPRLASARWAPGQALLRRADSTTELSFQNLDELSRQLLGETLPLAALPDWLQGRPWPQASHQALADGGFEQGGWRVLLTRRAEGWIEARRDAAPAVLLRVKLDDPS